MSCAGPTTPFGGVSFFSGDGSSVFGLFSDTASEKLQISPSRQNLHMSYSLVLSAQVETSLEPRLRVLYNNKDITRTFKKNLSSQSRAEEGMKYTFGNLRLPASELHDIQIFVEETDSDGNLIETYSIKHSRPECILNEAKNVQTTKPFSTRGSTLREIQDLAQREGLSPAFITGLIAQESGFDSKALSRSRALGLTQITPLADRELRKNRPEWRRDSRIESLSLYSLRSLIESGQLTANSDWRMNESQSIEGGVLYVKYLLSYWSLPENKKLLENMTPAERSDVILASYNSGASRVKRNIIERQKLWMTGSELKEAFKYINKVSSYCYHFAGK